MIIDMFENGKNRQNSEALEENIWVVSPTLPLGCPNYRNTFLVLHLPVRIWICSRTYSLSRASGNACGKCVWVVFKTVNTDSQSVLAKINYKGNGER